MAGIYSMYHSKDIASNLGDPSSHFGPHRGPHDGGEQPSLERDGRPASVTGDLLGRTAEVEVEVVDLPLPGEEAGRRAEVDRIDGIVEGLLSLARPEPLQYATVDLAEIESRTGRKQPDVIT